MPDQAAHSALCVYCLRVSDGTGFNREHIIPQCIGGTLFVDNMVCESCNSTLGTEVDCEILKVPEVLSAMDALHVPYDREGVLRSYYNTELVSQFGRLKAMPVGNGFQPITQDLEDGSRITPGHEVAVETLRKTLSRDVSLQATGITREHISALLSDLGERFAKAEDEDEVECSELGLNLEKRSDKSHVEASPKSEPATQRLIGKIALEWLFLCFGKSFVASAPWSCDLRNLVCGSDNPQTIGVFRSEPMNPEIRKTHSIYVYLHESFAKVAVTFFGGIEFTMIAPPMPLSVLEEFTSATDTPDSIGIAYEQDLSEGEKRFFALKTDGSSKFLGAL
jgi:hypothetical protein